MAAENINPAGDEKMLPEQWEGRCQAAVLRQGELAAELVRQEMKLEAAQAQIAGLQKVLDRRDVEIAALRTALDMAQKKAVQALGGR